MDIPKVEQNGKFWQLRKNVNELEMSCLRKKIGKLFGNLKRNFVGKL